MDFKNDTDSREQPEEVLKEREAFFRQLTENINEVFWIRDLKTDRIVYVSPAYERIFGRSCESLYDHPEALMEAIHPDDRHRIEESRSAKTQQVEFRIVRPDGAVRWMRNRIFPVRNSAGEVDRICGVSEDFTEHKRAEEALRETQVRLIQSEKMAALGNLVAGIAHEINTPVGAINSMHDTLVRAVDKLKEALETSFPRECRENRVLQSSLKVISDANRVIATGTERVTEIVRSLRSFARLDEAEMKEADLHEGIDNTLMLVHHDLKNRVEVVKAYGDIPQIVCFPSRLNQVLLNILVNASQAIDGEGKITIRTYLRDEKVHVAIQDTGGGISEEDLQKVFDPGFTTKGVGVGTGLGLSICYQIIQDHKGEIRVESRVGEGTTFTVIVPTDLEEGS